LGGDQAQHRVLLGEVLPRGIFDPGAFTLNHEGVMLVSAQANDTSGVGVGGRPTPEAQAAATPRRRIRRHIPKADLA
jgi:hypothetical protein